MEVRIASYVEKCMMSRVKSGKEWSWKGVKHLFKRIFKGVVQDWGSVVQARESITVPPNSKWWLCKLQLKYNRKITENRFQIYVGCGIIRVWCLIDWRWGWVEELRCLSLFFRNWGWNHRKKEGGREKHI